MKKNLEKEVIPEEGTFERYKYDIKKELMECAWKYTAEEADRVIEKDIDYVREGYENGEESGRIAVNIGYTCG